MKRLPLPSNDTAREDFEAAVRTYNYRGIERGYDPTPAEIDAVLQQYDAYDAAGGAANEAFKGLDFEQALVETIKSAFQQTQQDRRLSHLREAIMSGVDCCPICSIDPVRHLDHYLPGSVYKLMAIYSHNLVPICAVCNEKKRARIAGPNGHRFVHPYFDALPDTTFLTAQVSIGRDGLACLFGVADNAALPDGLADRIIDQFDALELNRRYAREINLYVGGVAMLLHGLYPKKGKVGVSQFLSTQADYESGRFHTNDWRAVVFRALSAHEAFCDGGFSAVFPLPEGVEPHAY